MAIETEFTYGLAQFISFRDLSACERVRSIRRSELAEHPNPEFRIRMSRGARFTEHSPTTSWAGSGPPATTGVSSSHRGRRADAAIRARSAHDQRRAALAAHVHTFNMDEYASEDASPLLSRGRGLQRAMLERFFALVDPDLRPPGSRNPLPDHGCDRRLSARLEDLAAPTSVTAASAGGHIAFWGHTSATSSKATSTPTSRQAGACLLVGVEVAFELVAEVGLPESDVPAPPIPP